MTEDVDNIDKKLGLELRGGDTIFDSENSLEEVSLDVIRDAQLKLRKAQKPYDPAIIAKKLATAGAIDLKKIGKSAIGPTATTVVKAGFAAYAKSRPIPAK